MQNDPRLHNDPESSQPAGLPAPDPNSQTLPASPLPASGYAEPEYKEYAPPAYGNYPVAGNYTPVQQPYPPAYNPSGAPANSGYWAPPQPGYPYVPQTPQPGVVPATPQPYAPNVLPAQPQTPKRLSLLAIGGLALAVLVILAIAIVSISALNNQKSTVVPTPTLATQANSTTLATSTSGLGQTTSAFQSASCPFTVGQGLTEGQQVTCGYVTVPENRATNSGAKVKLAVAIFKAQAYMTTPDPAPVLRLDGGPGGPSLNGWGSAVTASTYNDFVFNHDLVMFDQRGTGYSTPSLQCSELIKLQTSPTDVSNPTTETAAQACHDRLVSNGVDLNAFNTIQNADDVSDVIHALGYKQMTLYGVSYGTRLALTVLRLHPDVVHAAVLDSVYPTTHTRVDLPSDAQRVFNVLFQGCAKDSTCNSKYPNLQSTFYSLVDQLNAKPISFTTTDGENGQQYTAPLSGNDLISFIFSALYVTQFIPQLPQIIYQVKNQEYSLMSRLYGILEFDSTFSDGMFYSATCSEDWAFLTQQDIAKSEQGIEPHLAKVFGEVDEQLEYATCKFWNVQAVPSSQKQAVTSNVPTLITTGEYDPITPPANGQEVAKYLSHSYFFQFPGQGHGQQYSSACSNTIISAFEDNPNQQPDGSCIDAMNEPAFT